MQIYSRCAHSTLNDTCYRRHSSDSLSVEVLKAQNPGFSWVKFRASFFLHDLQTRSRQTDDSPAKKSGDNCEGEEFAITMTRRSSQTSGIFYERKVSCQEIKGGE